MSAEDAIVYGLLGAGVGVELIACLGVALMSGVYDRLHYLAPATVGAILIVTAIWVREGPSTIALEATLVAAFILFAAPALAHGTARAARLAEHDDWRPQPGEGIEVERA
jgi:monovalent cation/proton antiporter MnhG/PhaG subunit